MSKKEKTVNIYGDEYKDDNTLLVAIMAVLLFGVSIMIMMKPKEDTFEIDLSEFEGQEEIFIKDPYNYDYTQDIEIGEPLPEIALEDHGGLPEVLPPLFEGEEVYFEVQ